MSRLRTLIEFDTELVLDEYLFTEVILMELWAYYVS
jgi:hypothetical protein